MGQFIGEVDLTVLPGPDNWRVKNNFSYVTNAGETITVTAGFQTDLASTPRIIWSLYPPFGSYTSAAVLHDTLYKRQPYERSKCDAILLEAMQAEGVSWMTRHIIYRQVRIWGWIAWNEHRRENARRTNTNP